MSRLDRVERTAPSKGRPKRRAASTHLFKYQLSKNPSRAEEKALKKALQDSLEEQTSVHLVEPSSGGKDSVRAKGVINSSTNSSDVSKNSNSSSSTTNQSCDSFDNSATKRTRSGGPPPYATLSLDKRAKLTTNGVKANNITNDNTNKCDTGPPLSRSSSLPQVHKAIATSSRGGQQNNHHSQHQQKRNSCHNPRSSTPIAKKTIFKVGTTNIDGCSERKNQVPISKSTQTVSPNVKPSNNILSNGHSSNNDEHKSSKSSKEDGTSISQTSNISHQQPLISDQYLKLKRESKNYAYAKMTALKVNTYKSPHGYFKSTKKVSQAGVLNNNTTKNNGKSSPIMTKTPSPNQHITNVPSQDSKPGKKSPTLYLTKAVSQQEKNSNSDGNNAVPKLLPDTPHGDKHDQISNTSLEISFIKGQNSTNVSLTKKRIAQGSWSLLGVPEEKIIYLRDDEPPRRLICYPAIKHVEGDTIQVRDSVLLRSGAKTTDLPYIAKVCAFWEDAETGGVMMSLFWYYRPEHIEEGRKPHHLPDEIFASRHRDVDSVECIDDKCYVLTFNEYCRYRKRAKMEQVGTTWSLADVTIPVSNESYPRRNRIPDSNVNPELVFTCRQIYDSRMKRLIKNPLINSKYGHI